MVCSIAIDAMGGDRAPGAVVRGAVAVATQYGGDVHLHLVGREAEVRAELQQTGWSGSNIELVAAEHVIEMGDSPVEALRRKKGSSIEVATRLVREGRAEAMVSAGNTGACVAAGTLLLGLLPEVRRAGIAVAVQPGARPVVVIDVGANITSKPEHLIQYGIMANLYAREVLGVETPRVGLLNIGEESQKGNSLAKTTNSLFRDTALNYLGNIEGGDIFSGHCDVVVCDGFVGNIVLKVSEGLAECMVGLFKGLLEESLRDVVGQLRKGHVETGEPATGEPATGEPPATKEAASKGEGGLERLFRESLGGLQEKIDYSEYGGAPLLGVNGVMIIAHGRSDAKAISNAVRAAKRMAEANVNKHITEEIRALSGQKEAS